MARTGEFVADTSTWPEDHPRVNYGRIGVLLLNLGTPDGTSYWPMRRYLHEFLGRIGASLRSHAGSGGRSST